MKQDICMAYCRTSGKEHPNMLNITDMKVSGGWDKEIVEHRQEQLKRVDAFY